MEEKGNIILIEINKKFMGHDPWKLMNCTETKTIVIACSPNEKSRMFTF